MVLGAIKNNETGGEESFLEWSGQAGVVGRGLFLRK